MKCNKIEVSHVSSNTFNHKRTVIHHIVIQNINMKHTHIYTNTIYTAL